jgi:hypothetical protein
MRAGVLHHQPVDAKRPLGYSPIYRRVITIPDGFRVAYTAHDLAHGLTGTVAARRSDRFCRDEWHCWPIDSKAPVPIPQRSRREAARALLYVHTRDIRDLRKEPKPMPRTTVNDDITYVLSHHEDSSRGYWLALSHIASRLDQLQHDRTRNPGALWHELAYIRSWCETALTYKPSAHSNDAENVSTADHQLGAKSASADEGNSGSALRLVQ